MNDGKRRYGRLRPEGMTLDELVELGRNKQLHGRVRLDVFGEVVLRFRNGVQEVIGKVDTIDSHSPAQMKIRSGWRNLQRSYMILKPAIRGLWEAKKGEKRKVDSAYMSANMLWQLDEDMGYALTDEEAKNGACKLFPWQVSDGSLKPIRVTDGVSSIQVGKRFKMTETTTVAELSGAMILASKSRWQEGDVLTYVELVQKDYSKEEGGDGIPRCMLLWGKMTLDLQDERPLRKVLPKTGIAVKDGYLAHEPYVEPAWGKHEARVLPSGYCWIKSRKVKGNWHHSRQRLVVDGVSL